MRALVLSSDISRPAFICARRAADFLLGGGLGTPHDLVDQHRHQLGDLVLAGAGVDAEDAAVEVRAEKDEIE